MTAGQTGGSANGTGGSGGRVAGEGEGGGRRRRRRRGRRSGSGNGRKRGAGARAPKAKSPATGARNRRPRARREHSAGGVVVRLDNTVPLVLLIRDSYGHWGFPKGHLERGERADSAAVREVIEETGLKAVSVLGSIATINWYFRFRGALIHKNCEFFLMQTSTPTTKPQKSEGITACKWTTLDEARRLIAYDNARDVLVRAGEMLGSRDGSDVSPRSTPIDA
jgi:8-oxo-dGTP pyrophosphatase MutT (NUDIX family)